MTTLADLIKKLREDPLLNERLLERKLQIHINGAVYSVNDFDAVFRRDSSVMVLDITPGFHKQGEQQEPREDREETPELGENKEVSEEERGRMLSDEDILGFIHNKREQVKKNNG